MQVWSCNGTGAQVWEAHADGSLRRHQPPRLGPERLVLLSAGPAAHSVRGLQGTGDPARSAHPWFRP
ncbi:hypothetical protein [Streptomyces sp. RKND-216]|uniref:hypothetical protein n=1 Tax=Streptomyces sp. RKND-216 TaxID=2562581 RepID=UPI001FFAE45A|nr:hypothetical protein [Streptomyces sp. RKND-216]